MASPTEVTEQVIGIVPLFVGIAAAKEAVKIVESDQKREPGLVDINKTRFV